MRLASDFRLACFLPPFEFQNWMTTENSDAFTLYRLSLRRSGPLHQQPRAHRLEASTEFRTASEWQRGFLWTDARVSGITAPVSMCQNALSFPDAAPGGNTQGLIMYCKGETGGALVRLGSIPRPEVFVHAKNPTTPARPSTLSRAPIFPVRRSRWPRSRAVGYGYRSVEHIIQNCIRHGIGESIARWTGSECLPKSTLPASWRTPNNSSYNEQVIEAARESILNGERPSP